MGGAPGVVAKMVRTWAWESSGVREAGEPQLPEKLAHKKTYLHSYKLLPPTAALSGPGSSASRREPGAGGFRQGLGIGCLCVTAHRGRLWDPCDRLWNYLGCMGCFFKGTDHILTQLGGGMGRLLGCIGCFFRDTDHILTQLGRGMGRSAHSWELYVAAAAECVNGEKCSDATEMFRCVLFKAGRHQNPNNASQAN